MRDIEIEDDEQHENTVRAGSCVSTSGLAEEGKSSCRNVGSCSHRVLVLLIIKNTAFDITAIICDVFETIRK